MANLEPVHGLSLRDYVEITRKIAEGIPQEAIFEAVGIDQAIFDELNTIWPARMAEDDSFEITTLFGKYYSEPIANAKLQALSAEASADGADNLERLRDDPFFYQELSAARDAAYKHGLDGAQWILDNYGINLADFQSVAMQYMNKRNSGEINLDDLHEQMDYRNEMAERYDAYFAEQQGGNVADDIDF